MNDQTDTREVCYVMKRRCTSNLSEKYGSTGSLGCWVNWSKHGLRGRPGTKMIDLYQFYILFYIN